MMIIDFSSQVAPMMTGVVALLVVAVAGIVGCADGRERSAVQVCMERVAERIVAPLERMAIAGLQRLATVRLG